MKTNRIHWLAPVLGLVLANCGGGDEDAAARPKKTQSAAQKLCAEIADYADSCGGSPCVDALVADCSNVVGLLSDPRTRCSPSANCYRDRREAVARGSAAVRRGRVAPQAHVDQIGSCG